MRRSGCGSKQSGSGGRSGRPFVVVDVEPGWILYLTIENIGTTLARDVQFSFTPTLASTGDRPWEFENSPLLRDGVATFPPRKRYRIFFDGIQERLSRGDLPMKYAVRVTYEDDDGNSYDDGYTLDLNTFVNTSPDEKGIPDLVKELELYARPWTSGPMVRAAYSCTRRIRTTWIAVPERGPMSGAPGKSRSQGRRVAGSGAFGPTSVRAT